MDSNIIQTWKILEPASELPPLQKVGKDLDSHSKASCCPTYTCISLMTSKALMSPNLAMIMTLVLHFNVFEMSLDSLKMIRGLTNEGTTCFHTVKKYKIHEAKGNVQKNKLAS